VLHPEATVTTVAASAVTTSSVDGCRNMALPGRSRWTICGVIVHLP
jgi:hypothetical protein